jgi:RES domain-containing protein
LLVFRLGSSRYPANDGAGASQYGGRWNHKGTSVIYTAESRALCALEVLASADELADDYVATPIELTSGIAIMVTDVGDLPAGWNANEPLDATRDIGTNWAAGLATAVLSVPSAVIPQERNYILNPAHTDFARIRFYSPIPFHFDDRLRRSK